MIKFTNDERIELLNTINYSRGKIDSVDQQLLNEIAVKVNFGYDSYSNEELYIILQIIGLYLNKANSANSTHITLYHRIDNYNNIVA